MRDDRTSVDSDCLPTDSWRVEGATFSASLFIVPLLWILSSRYVETIDYVMKEIVPFFVAVWGIPAFAGFLVRRSKPKLFFVVIARFMSVNVGWVALSFIRHEEDMLRMTAPICAALSIFDLIMVWLVAIFIRIGWLFAIRVDRHGRR